MWLKDESRTLAQQHGLVYPEAALRGPGHADLAQSMARLALSEWRGRLEALKAECGAKADQTVVLSSEDFASSVIQQRWDHFAALDQCFEIERLIVTYTPLTERFLSTVNEQIKHLQQVDLDRLPIDAVRSSSPGMHPAFLARIAALLPHVRKSIIVALKDDPGFLYRSFAELLGIAPPPESRVANVRLEDLDLRVMNALNLVLRETRIQHKLRDDEMAKGRLKQLVRRIGRETAQAFKDVGVDSPPIQLDKAQRAYLDGAAEMEFAYLDELAQSGKIDLIRPES